MENPFCLKTPKADEKLFKTHRKLKVLCIHELLILPSKPLTVNTKRPSYPT